MHKQNETLFPTHRYRYVVSPERTFGTKLPDGSWTGMMGMVVREVRQMLLTHSVQLENHFISTFWV